MPRTLPRWMHLNHGRYYLVRKNKWTPLSRNLHDALVEYARLTAGPDAVALLIASGFGTFVVIYFACHYTLTGRWFSVTSP